MDKPKFTLIGTFITCLTNTTNYFATDCAGKMENVFEIRPKAQLFIHSCMKKSLIHPGTVINKHSDSIETPEI